MNNSKHEFIKYELNISALVRCMYILWMKHT